jgi:hypothetical protein
VAQTLTLTLTGGRLSFVWATTPTLLRSVSLAQRDQTFAVGCVVPPTITTTTTTIIAIITTTTNIATAIMTATTISPFVPAIYPS